MDLATKVFLYLLYCAFRVLYHCIQSFNWWIYGTSYKLKTNRRNYNLSAQVCDVMWKYKLDKLEQPPSRLEFVYTHQKFVDPEYVLQDHVTLYYVTSSEAIFVETDPGIDVTKSSTNCFLRAAQYEHAKRLIILPMSSFQALAAEVGDPVAKVIILTNTGRCGSTLVTQIFENTGRCVCLSEPPFFNFPVEYGDTLSQKEVDGIMLRCLRLQCKPRKDKDIDAFLLKTKGQHTQFAQMYARIYKHCKLLYMYRNGLKTTESFFRVSQTLEMPRVANFIDGFIPIRNKLMGVKLHPDVKKLDGTTFWLYV